MYRGVTRPERGPGEASGGTTEKLSSPRSRNRTLRVAEEPLDLFRRDYATYVREQAWCHLSPALVANLERFWNASSRRA
ncbi:MAG TPA: hypothetical protein VF274_14255 [Alphaproteobacteria bacterium]